MRTPFNSKISTRQAMMAQICSRPQLAATADLNLRTGLLVFAGPPAISGCGSESLGEVDSLAASLDKSNNFPLDRAGGRCEGEGFFEGEWTGWTRWTIWTIAAQREGGFSGMDHSV